MADVVWERAGGRHCRCLLSSGPPATSKVAVLLLDYLLLHHYLREKSPHMQWGVCNKIGIFYYIAKNMLCIGHNFV